MTEPEHKAIFASSFDSLMLPPAAKEWLLDLSDVIQAMDDWYDDDKEVSKDSKQEAIYKALVLLPSNPFYLQFSNVLSPVLSNAILKWSGANSKEANGTADAKSYMWRASFYDVILAVVSIVHGPFQAMQVSAHIANLYGESFEEYLKEFKHG